MSERQIHVVGGGGGGGQAAEQSGRHGGEGGQCRPDRYFRLPQSIVSAIFDLNFFFSFFFYFFFSTSGRVGKDLNSCGKTWVLRVLGLEGAFRAPLSMGAWEWLAGLTLMPLVVKVNPNFNVVATACLTVFIGCHRSVKPAPPSVSFRTPCAVGVYVFEGKRSFGLN